MRDSRTVVRRTIELCSDYVNGHIDMGVYPEVNDDIMSGILVGLVAAYSAMSNEFINDPRAVLMTSMRMSRSILGDVRDGATID